MASSITRRLLLAASFSAIGLLVGSCSSDSDESGSDHNKQDIKFATDMIPHHAQALEMAQLASTRADNPEVKQLAQQIQAAQQPEIDKMNGWLAAWGKSTVNPGDTKSMSHSAHSGMAGMMSDKEMNAMEGAGGTAFDKLFLNGMIKHHEGAVEMAETQQSKGKFEPAKALASAIITGQQAEIETMRRLLG